MRFEWNAPKALANVGKHGVSFEAAITVFDDPLALVQADDNHPDRLVIMGESSSAKLLFVVYVEYDRTETIRIISARKATHHERKAYQER